MGLTSQPAQGTRLLSGYTLQAARRLNGETLAGSQPEPTPVKSAPGALNGALLGRESRT
jgi:hypothetical protein